MAVEVYFIWVGQGDCTLIKTAENTTILIDCGSSDRKEIYEGNVKPTINSVMGSIGKTEIDYLILTHDDRDHYGFIVNLCETYTFNNVYYGGTASQYNGNGYKIDLYDKRYFKNTNNFSSHYYSITNLFIDEADCKMYFICANYPYKKDPPEVPCGRDINIPGNRNSKIIRNIYDTNGNSVVVKMVSKGYRIVFMGDSTISQQKFIDESLSSGGHLGELNCNLLKMSHHGSDDSFDAELTSKSLKPSGLFASAGIKCGHPDWDIVKSVATVVNTAVQHEYVVFKKSDSSYTINNDTLYFYNTNNSFNVSENKVPKITSTGKKNNNKHAGKAYIDLHGSNIKLTINDGSGEITRGRDVIILSNSSIERNVANRRKRRRPGGS